jgi:hypothetical protein
LVDQSACFNIFVVPAKGPPAAIPNPAGRGTIGFNGSGAIHRFGIDLRPPSVQGGIRVANVVGECVGQVCYKCRLIPYEFKARPRHEPPPTVLDAERSQRFSLQEMTLTFGNGGDGFHCFGAGRTFPMLFGKRPSLLAMAVCNISEGQGQFQGCEGNLTFCGKVRPDQGFTGHAVIRVVDQKGRLRTQAAIAPPQPLLEPDPGTTYLMWGAQKGTTPDQANRFSLAPDGQVRGMIVPVQLKLLTLDFDVRGPSGFRCADLRVGEALGLESGCGRGADPDAPPTGTPLSPYEFEGVARYTFQDRGGRPVGAITTNVLEGRRFDVTLAGARDQTAWRFGFFGPIVYGSGCFHGVRGMFYGASGSVFNPPPGDHVITHLYMACLDDRHGHFRDREGDE